MTTIVGKDCQRHAGPLAPGNYKVTLNTPLKVPVAGHRDWVGSRTVSTTLLVR